MEAKKLANFVIDSTHDFDIIARIRRFRQEKFQQFGIAAVDIETCLDNTGDHSIYNMRPFLCHVYGEL